MTKTNSLLQTAQPYLRDQYVNVRDGLAPTLAHTRDVAVPIALDASHRAMDMSKDVSNRMRNEILPVAGKRAMLAAAALRGAELQQQHERSSKWRLIAVAGAAGAALGAGAYVWQRKRAQECWCEECAEDNAEAREDAPHVEAH